MWNLTSTCSASSIHRLNRGPTVPLCFSMPISEISCLAAMATADLYTPSIPVSVKSRYLTSLLLPPSS